MIAVRFRASVGKRPQSHFFAGDALDLSRTCQENPVTSKFRNPLLALTLKAPEPFLDAFHRQRLASSETGVRLVSRA